MIALGHGRLRRPGAVLLVSCYELGHPPHGLAMTAGFLERAGFAPAVHDLSVARLPDAAIDAAALVVVSTPMHTALRLGVRLAERIRARNPAAAICFTGNYAAMNAAGLARLGVALGGEHEAALVALVEQLDRGEPAAPPAAVTLAKLDFPRPRRARLPALDHYARLDRGDGDERLVGYTEATRGCLDRCRHCPVPAVYGGRLFAVDRGLVLDDIAAQVDAGAEHITFGDPDFLNGPGHARAILRELHRRWPALSFDVTAQISHLLDHRDLVAELPGLGCAFVVSAVESLSDRVLATLHKRHRRAQVIAALAVCRSAGLPLRPTFVPFTPWTELGDLVELGDFLAGEDLLDQVDPIQLTIRLLVPPGSLLLADPEAERWFGPLDPDRLSHTWVHPDPRVDRLQAALAARVEAAAAAAEPPHETHRALRQLIHAAAGVVAPTPLLLPRRRVPRLTEPWFC